MASKTFARTLRTASKQKLSTQPLQKRTFSSALATRPAAVAAVRTAFAGPVQQTRGVKTIDFAGHKEQVFEREDWPREKLLVSLIHKFFSARESMLTSPVGILQERHTCIDRLWLPRSRSRPQPPRQRSQCHHWCTKGWRVMERGTTRWLDPWHKLVRDG